MKTLDHLKRYKKLCNLHPYDGFQLLLLEENIYRAVGGEEQDVVDGWRAMYVFLRGLTKTTTNWGENQMCSKTERTAC